MPEPTLPDSFEWVTQPWGRALVCRPLAEAARHLFTTRQLRLTGSETTVAEGWAAVGTALGVAADHVVRLTQVHGAEVVAVPGDVAQARAGGTWADADALVTDLPDIVLAVKVADCVPILIADRRRPAVAAVHAGWRGTVAGVSPAAVRALVDRYGSSPADLVAAIGPSIGGCCYQVGTDVHDQFLEAGANPHELADWFTLSPKPAAAAGIGPGHAARSAGTAVQAGKFWLDTWQANADQLADAGIPRAQIHVSGLCTACLPGLFHSYRVDGSRAGRMVGAIRASSENNSRS